MASHKALITRLLFILTRCSRLVLLDDSPSTSYGGGGVAAFGTQLRVGRGERWRRLSGFNPLTGVRRGAVGKLAAPTHGAGASPKSPIVRAVTMPSRWDEICNSVAVLSLWQRQQAQCCDPSSACVMLGLLGAGRSRTRRE